MTARIKILPSGHEFNSEGNHTLLEAGLSAGLRLGYGCSNGNCGECLARVVSGQVEKTRHHDFRISAADKTDGHVLMCRNTAVGDVVLEAQEASSSQQVPEQQLTAKVKAINFVTEEMALLHLKTPRTRRLRFLAGQAARLGGNGKASATHSIASCPCDDMQLHFQIPRQPTSDFSRYVFDQLKRGDSLELVGPYGDFILDEDSPNSLVFIAWKSGFSSIRSLVEHAMSLEVAEQMVLVWVADGDEGRYLDNLCRSWADALDDFTYLPVNADGEDPQGCMAEIGRVLNLPEQQQYDYYVAGNKAILDATSAILLQQGVSPSRLRFDQILHD